MSVIILAAGESTRMGHPKQLLEYRGKSFLRGAIDTALAVAEQRVVVVLGAKADLLRNEAEGRAVTMVENPRWSEGMGSSLRCGLETLLHIEPGSRVVLVMLCDQPMVSSLLLRTLIEEHRRTGKPVVASHYEETAGVPALFERSLFPELLALSGREGARRVIQQFAAQTALVPFPEGALDIDLPSDYERLVAAPETSTAIHR